MLIDYSQLELFINSNINYVPKYSLLSFEDFIFN